MRYFLENTKNMVEIKSRGAELTSFMHKNVEYIHQPSPLDWNRSAPFLFPNIGALKNKVTYIDDKEYTLPKHGFLRDLELTLIAKTNNSLMFMAKDSPETLAVYPYHFNMTITYTLAGDELSCSIELINPSTTPLYFNFGLHPAFRVPLFNNERFEDYLIEFQNPVTCSMPTVDLSNGLVDYEKVSRTFKKVKTLPLNYADYQNDALIIDKFKDHHISLYNPSTNKGIDFTFKPFKTLGIWTPNHVKANFICLEPWNGCADNYNSRNFIDKKDIIELEGKGVWTASFKISIRD